MSKINLSPINNLQNESTVTATINNNNTLITAAVENSISRDGTLPNHMNARLDMNSNQIINLPDAFTDQEPVTYGQFVEGITSVNNGVVVDGDFVVLAHNDTMLNDRVLTAGENIEIVDGGSKGNVEVRVGDPQLNAIANVVSDVDKLPYFTGTATADVTDFTPFARTLLDDVDAATARATIGSVIGTDVQPHDIDLDAIAGLATTGLLARTGSGTADTRTVTGTSNEITVINGDGVAGNPTVSLPASLTFTGKTVSGGSFTSPAITTPTGIVKGDVGLGNVDNTSDVNKPISTATQTALDAKVAGPASSVNSRVAIFSGTTGKIIADGGQGLPAGTIVGTTDTQTLTNKTLTSPSITTPTGIVKGDVGLGNVDNTSDATKNAAAVTLTNKTISGSTNTLSNIANASLSTAADSTIKSNISGSTASVSDNTITAVLDKQLGTTQGTIAYRGASTWDALTPGTSGNFLKTNGAAANPAWAAIPGGGDLLSTNNLSDVASSTTALYNLQGAPKKNYIINGAMMVSQENGTTAGTTSGYYPVDQFSQVYSNSGVQSAQQVASLTPGGSPNRLRVTVTTADATVAVGDYLSVITRIEGLRAADLKIGTSSAKQIVIQFGVKAPAGTYCVAVRNGANNRSYVGEYTISAGEANTDTVKTILLTLDTAGTWASNNTTGIEIAWTLMCGTTYQATAGAWASGNFFGSSNQFNFMGTNGNVFELFDVELCEGSSAPDFVVPDYADTLRQCQRHWQKIGGEGSSTAPVVHGYTGAGLNYYVSLTLQTMRAAPTGAKFGTWSVSNSSQPSVNVTSTNCVTLTAVATAAGAALFYPADATCYFTLNARL